MAIAMFLTFCAVFFLSVTKIALLGVLDIVSNAFFTHSLLTERFLKCKSNLYLVTIYNLMYCVLNLSNVPNISLPLILLYFIVLSMCSISLWELPEKIMGLM